MKSFAMARQGGQAMTELVVAMLVLMPIFFGIIYMGKLSDIKHQAIQASRFAAMERALDPLSKHENAQVLQDEARERFFTDGTRNGGKIGYQDTTAGLTTASTLNPNWSEVTGTPLIQSYDGITVTTTSGSMSIGAFAPINVASGTFDHLNRNGVIQADVSVPIANIVHLPAPLNNLNLTLAATTVIAGDAWNGGGVSDVASEQTAETDMGKDPVLQGLKVALTPLAAVFSDTSAPKFGCLRPDVMPQNTAPGANYQPGDACY